MAFATISADIVASSSLSNEAKIGLNESLKKCIGTLESHYGGFWGRIVRGDSVECIVEKPEDALEIALILKTWVKAYGPNVNSAANEFKKYGIRLAIGIGDMSIIDKSRDIMDGDAIYRSGRSLDGLSGWSKYSMVISMYDNSCESALQVMLSFANHILNGATARQCETLCNRLLAHDAQEAAELMGISVSGLNQTLIKVGWGAIEQMLIYYRTKIGDIH